MIMSEQTPPEDDMIMEEVVALDDDDSNDYHRTVTSALRRWVATAEEEDGSHRQDAVRSLFLDHLNSSATTTTPTTAMQNISLDLLLRPTHGRLAGAGRGLVVDALHQGAPTLNEVEHERPLLPPWSLRLERLAQEHLPHDDPVSIQQNHRHPHNSLAAILNQAIDFLDDDDVHVNGDDEQHDDDDYYDGDDREQPEDDEQQDFLSFAF